MNNKTISRKNNTEVLLMRRFFSLIKWQEMFLILLGCVIYSIGANVFIIHNKIAPGGATGIATMLNYLFNLPVGVIIIIINIPLFLLAKKVMSIEILIKNFFATFLLSVSVDALSFLPVYSQDRLLACLFGGLLSGIGLGIVYSIGLSTGGSDLAARLIKQKLTHYSLGQLILALDAVVITAATFVFRDITSSMYSIIAIFISTKVIDALLNGYDNAKIALIISGKAEEISKQAITELERTTTRLLAKGGFSGINKEIVMCVVRRQELYRIKRIVEALDDNAFMIVMDAGEVLGLGFKEIEENY